MAGTHGAGQPSRGPDDCRYRQPKGFQGDSACCLLLAEIIGLAETSACSVQRDACEACCRSFPPSARHPNPVVASLLHELCSQVISGESAVACDRATAERLIEFAVENLGFDDSSPDDESWPGLAAGSNGTSLVDLVPIPDRRTGPKIDRWAVGVTTAGREVPTLDQCLPGLLRAGWESPRLFIDGDVQIAADFSHLARTCRVPAIGAWPNYYLALVELLMRQPDADAFLIVQDDVLFSDRFPVRSYLEQALWPGDGAGIASLFCARAYTQAQAGWHRLRRAWRLGAQAFVFSRDAAQRFLADREVVLHRWNRHRNGLADISWRVGQWAFDADVPVYFTTPSLVQHVGEVSTIWPKARVVGNRRASRFVGDVILPPHTSQVLHEAHIPHEAQIDPVGDSDR